MNKCNCEDYFQNSRRKYIMLKKLINVAFSYINVFYFTSKNLSSFAVNLEGNDINVTTKTFIENLQKTLE